MCCGIISGILCIRKLIKKTQKSSSSGLTSWIRYLFQFWIHNELMCQCPCYTIKFLLYCVSYGHFKLPIVQFMSENLCWNIQFVDKEHKLIWKPGFCVMNRLSHRDTFLLSVCPSHFVSACIRGWHMIVFLRVGQACKTEKMRCLEYHYFTAVYIAIVVISVQNL